MAVSSVVIEALACLPAQSSLFNHLLKERSWLEAVAVLVLEDLSVGLDHINADEV